MPIVRHAATRRSETPNAVMTTLASPTLGEAGLSVWRVEMTPDAVGPEHVFDVEQVWTIMGGSATLDLDGVSNTLATGDTAIPPAGQMRRLRAGPGAGLTALVACVAGARALMPDGTDRGTPPWIA